MERPGLRQLIADVEAGKIDIIVVYKVDRLTRGLADFARIVDVLDRQGACSMRTGSSRNMRSAPSIRAFLLVSTGTERGKG